MLVLYACEKIISKYLGTNRCWEWDLWCPTRLFHNFLPQGGRTLCQCIANSRQLIISVWAQFARGRCSSSSLATAMARTRLNFPTWFWSTACRCFFAKRFFSFQMSIQQMCVWSLKGNAEKWDIFSFHVNKTQQANTNPHSHACTHRHAFGVARSIRSTP